MLKNAVASGRSPSHAAAKEEEESCVEGETAVPAVNVLGRVEQQPVLVAAKTAPAVGGDLLRRARLRPDVERDVGRGDREAVAARHRRLEERQLVLAQAEFRLCFAGPGWRRLRPPDQGEAPPILCHGGREWNAGTGEKHVLSDNPALRTPAEEPAAAWPIRRTVSGRIVVACGRNGG